MSEYKLSHIQRIFHKCLKDAAVFERSVTDGQFFETNDIEKERKRWLVIAAGIDKREASDLFIGNRGRAERSLTPLTFKDGCKVSILFILRPLEEDLYNSQDGILAVPFASSNKIPWVEMSRSYVRILDIPENNSRLTNVRWEWDIEVSSRDPIEPWLNCWKNDCGFNPAHPPSHLHLNSTVLEDVGYKKRGDGGVNNDLRLAMGNVNPLAFLLSIAMWFRRI